MLAEAAHCKSIGHETLIEAVPIISHILDLPPELLKLVVAHVPAALCIALTCRRCREACPRQLRTPRSVVCHESLSLLHWAEATGCRPPRRVSHALQQIEVNLDELVASYRQSQPVHVDTLADGAIVPPMAEHFAYATLAYTRGSFTSTGERLTHPRPLTEAELQQIDGFTQFVRAPMESLMPCMFGSRGADGGLTPGTFPCPHLFFWSLCIVSLRLDPSWWQMVTRMWPTWMAA